MEILTSPERLDAALSAAACGCDPCQCGPSDGCGCQTQARSGCGCDACNCAPCHCA